MRRSSRETRKPKRCSPPDFRSHFAFSIIDDDPRNVKDFVDSEDNDLWKKVVVEEINSLDKSESWDLVELPSRRKSIGRKWLFKKKLNA